MEKQEKDKKQMPPRRLAVTIGSNTYEIKFPNNGDLLKVEMEKIAYTNGLLKDLMGNYNSAFAMDAYLAVEAAATFSVLVPDLIKDLNVPSLMDLDMLQSKTINKSYQLYWDWMKEWREFINQDVDEDVKK